MIVDLFSKRHIYSFTHPKLLLHVSEVDRYGNILLTKRIMITLIHGSVIYVVFMIVIVISLQCNRKRNRLHSLLT